MQTEGRAYCRIDVEGVLMDAPNLIAEISIIEHSANVGAVGQITLLDSSGKLQSELALVDGTRVSLAIGVSDAAPTYDFRVFSGRTVRTADTDLLTYHLISDAHQWWARSRTKAYKGTSAEAISRLASDCGLTADVTSTNDAQTWVSFCQSGASFGAAIAQHGWRNDTSCMGLAVLADKKVVYKDLNEALLGESVKTFTISRESDMLVNEARWTTTSGFRNAWMGYGYRDTWNDVLRDSGVLTEIQAQKVEGYLSINSDVKSEITWSRQDHEDQGAGNCHKHYEQARYQNVRNRSLFSQIGHLLFKNRITEVNLFDKVHIDMAETLAVDKSEVPDKNGGYLVFAKSRVLRGGTMYGERVAVMRPFVRKPGQTALVS